MEKRMHPGGTSKTISPNERIRCYEAIVEGSSETICAICRKQSASGWKKSGVIESPSFVVCSHGALSPCG